MSFATLLHALQVNDFVVAKMAALQSSLGMVLQQARRSSPSVTVLREEAARLELELISLDKFMRVNVVGFRKVSSWALGISLGVQRV